MVDDQASTPRRLWVIVAGLLAGALIGLVLGQSAGTSVSTSELLVSGSISLDPNTDTALQSNQYVSQRMPTYAQLASSDVVTGPATEQLGLEPGSLTGAVVATAVPETAVVQLEVSGPSPQAAQDRATAVTAALRTAIENIENIPASPTAPAQNRVRLSVVSEAGLPSAPRLSSTVLLVLGAVVGLGIGVAVRFELGRRERAEQRRRPAYDPTGGSMTTALPSRTPNGRAPTPSAVARPARDRP